MRKSNAEFEFLSLLGKFFTEYLPSSMNASPNTISSYKCAFRLLFQYLNEETDIETGHVTFEMLNFDLLTRPCLKNKSCTRNQVMRSYEHEAI